MTQAPRYLQLCAVRLWLAAAVLMLCGAALFVRAVNLQVMETEFLQNEGEARFLREVTIPTVRGSIYDRNGEPLAVSTPVDSIWAHPGKLLEEAEFLPMLAGLLDVPVEDLERQLTQRSDRQFVWLKRRVHPDLAGRLRELDIPGVFLQQEYRRFYPTGQVSAHVLGFTNIDDVGQEGLELSYNRSLQGEPGSKRVIKDLLGRIVQDVELIAEMKPGRDLQLSLDRRLQYQAFRELKRAVLEFEAVSGSVVVLDVNTGGILAMVNVPSHNPNSGVRSAAEARRNRAVTDVFEPGSVIKIFAMAAAMEAGLAEPTQVVDTTPGFVEVAGHTIRDVRNFGALSIAELLAKSSNVAIVDLVLKMDARHLWGVYSRFGFGSVSGSGFHGESAGVLRDHERWRKLEQATHAYGYNLAVTPLQLARATAAIAAGGRLRQPTFLLANGSPPMSVLDPVLAEQLSRMMEGVIEPGGTGTQAAIPGYRVAGKTGTSRKVGASGYSDRYVASFTGFAPASKPRLVVTVVINEPAGEAYYGGQVAAPVFARVMAAALRLFNVPPDRYDTLLAQAGDERG